MGGKMTTNYYELLEIRPDASSLDIINAYRRAKLAYRSDSLATYSLFDDGEADRIRAEIEQAYQTLTNPEKRQAYDAELASAHPQHRPGTPPGQSSHRPAAQASQQNNVVELADRALLSTGIRHRIAAATAFSGALLKEIRESRGVELAAIAERTKISRHYLQAIEEEDHRHLPAPAYLKGYLKQYAAEIGLDPERVSSHYPPLQADGSDSG